MDPISGVSFLQGDFRDEAVLDALLERINPEMVDVVMSDMAQILQATIVLTNQGQCILNSRLSR